MNMQIRLNSTQLSELGIIRDLSPEQVAEVVEATDRCEPPPLTPAELGAIFDATFGADNEAGEVLLKQVISLASLERQQGLGAEDVLGGLLYGIRSSNNPWNEAELAQWHAVEPEFRRLLEHPTIMRVAKALALSYDYANLLQEARIVADIRPLFDQAASRLEAAVVSFTLRLRYDSHDGNHGLSIAMNESDVKSLRAECDRALRKARIAADVMNGRAQVRTIVTGSDDESGGQDDVPR